ncbi:MAG: serine/threonine-protein kinase, partial [Planctomycetota bacterium]
QYLSRVCEHDRSLKESVQRLLAIDDTAQDFLETPAMRLSMATLPPTTGQRIGNYCLLEKIGSGGFGQVWKANQLEPVQRQVALKIIQLGLSNEQVMLRFEVERQALAAMNHPNIATIFDAGVTDSGRPFFAMELVTGQPIHRYCDQHHLPIKTRMHLMNQVCRAVQHAHHKGIVHLDLKPSNVLVAANEGQPIVKIIDFGIAKAIHRSENAEASSEDESTATETQLHATQLVGTPQYMSPEQAEIGQDVDTRADVYALGAMLYHLLSGAPPQCRDTAKTEWEVQRREICLESPRQLSNAASELPGAEKIARKRGATPHSLKRTLRSDPQWIVQKALEKNRNDRYQSPAELAKDIERYLGNRPVSAAPDKSWYRWRKLFYRNRVTFLAAGAVLVALAMGATAATVGFVFERQARKAAVGHWNRAERERASAVRERRKAVEQQSKAIAEANKALRFLQMLEDMLDVTNPAYGAPASFTRRNQLDEFAQSIQEQWEDLPHVEARLQRTVGCLYRSLKEYEKSRPHLERAYLLRKSHLDENSPLLAQTQVDYAAGVFAHSRGGEAERLLEPAIAALRQSPLCRELIEGLMLLGRIRNMQGRPEDFQKLQHEAWQLSQELYGVKHPFSLRYQAQAARQLLAEGKDTEAERLARDALEKILILRPAGHADIARVKLDLAEVLRRLKKAEQSRQQAQEALEIQQLAIGEESIQVAECWLAVARAERVGGDEETGIRLGRRAEAIAESATGGDGSVRYKIYQFLWAALSGRESVAAQAKANALARRLLPRSLAVADGTVYCAFRLRRCGELEQAATLYKWGIDAHREIAESPWKAAAARYALADLYVETEQWHLAREALTDTVALIDATRDEHYRWDSLRTVASIDLHELLIQHGFADETELSLAEAGDAESVRSLSLCAQLALADNEVDLAKSRLEDAFDLFHDLNRPGILWLRLEQLVAKCSAQSGNFDEAEAVLLKALQAVGSVSNARIHRRRIRRQLIQLYDNYGEKEKAAAWKAKLSI